MRPLIVRTPAEQGSHGASIALRTDAVGPARLVGVRVTMAVTEGRIGVGCLDRARPAMLDEAVVDAGSAATTVELLAGTPSSTGALLIRNASTAGPSVATVIDVQCLEVAAARDEWPVALSRPAVQPNWPRYYASEGSTLTEKARWRRFQGFAEPITVAWSDGLRFRVAPADQLSRVVYLSGTYEPNTLTLLRTWLRPGDVFVDAGANAGIVSMAAACWVGAQGRVLSIEPSAREFQRLAEHVALNGLPQVTTVRAALASHSGPRTLRVAASPRGGLNTLGDRFAYDGVETARLEPIDAITLDELVARERLDRVHVIKLDVEGAEVEALDGAASVLQTHRPALVLEVCATALGAGGSSVALLEARLRDAGYACFEIDDATGELRAVPGLSDVPDRNVVALPAERIAPWLDAAHGAE